MTDPVHLDRGTWARRSARGRGAADPAPVRIVHIGLGAFHRAHQAWYTHHASDASRWGIAAFTGRGPRAAELLAAQDGLYTLVERGPVADRVEVVGSIVEAHDGSRVDRLAELLSSPEVAIVTLTITEAGYRAAPDGSPDTDDPVVVQDIARLRARVTTMDPSGPGPAAPVSALGRLLLGLESRRRAGAGPIAVVPCDNIPRNGAVTRVAVLSLAHAVSESLGDFVAAEVSFVGTSVDRITPRVEDTDIPAVREAGWLDAAPVVTEPFSDWVLGGLFPAGRPDWVSAGAQVVDDVEPWEQRKLWLLNGAHSVLAWSGLVRGHETVAEAFGDGGCRALVEGFWAEAVGHLPAGTDTAAYRRALEERFANPRIVHRLSQIASDSATKVGFRVAAVAERSLDAGLPTLGSVPALAAWVTWSMQGSMASDTRSADVAAALAATEPTAALLAIASARLAADRYLVAAVRAALGLRDRSGRSVSPDVTGTSPPP